MNHSRARRNTDQNSFFYFEAKIRESKQANTKLDSLLVLERGRGRGRVLALLYCLPQAVHLQHPQSERSALSNRVVSQIRIYLSSPAYILFLLKICTDLLLVGFKQHADPVCVVVHWEVRQPGAGVGVHHHFVTTKAVDDDCLARHAVLVVVLANYISTSK